MPKSKSSKSNQAKAKRPAGINGLFVVLGILTTLLASVCYVVEQNLERFYIFDTEHLHDVSKRAIAAHGSNTTGVVHYIVSELNEKVPGYINLDEDWMFNNAGGAMGGMWILHASEKLQ